jgi:hypothetical protein
MLLKIIITIGMVAVGDSTFVKIMIFNYGRLKMVTALGIKSITTGRIYSSLSVCWFSKDKAF